MTDEQRIADLLDGEWHDEKPHHAGLSWPLVDRMQLMKMPPINRIRLLKAPAKADEQNKPVRSRDEQIASLNRHMRWDAKGKAESFIAEAEERGAAEGRGLSREDLAELVEGMSVSIDVSTGEHDSGNRLFGTVDETQYQSGDKNGLTLLVTGPEPNFNPANVAALEARVKELEAENASLTRRNALLNDPISGDHYERPDGLYEVDLEDSLSGVAGESSRGDITRVISWRKLGPIFILNASDENVERFSAFSSEEEAETARAALKREGDMA